MQSGPDPESITVQEHEHEAAVTYADGFSYRTELRVLSVDSTFYVRGAWTERGEDDAR